MGPTELAATRNAEWLRKRRRGWEQYRRRRSAAAASGRLATVEVPRTHSSRQGACMGPSRCRRPRNRRGNAGQAHPLLERAVWEHAQRTRHWQPGLQPDMVAHVARDRFDTWLLFDGSPEPNLHLEVPVPRHGRIAHGPH